MADIRTLIERVDARHQIELSRRRAQESGIIQTKPLSYIVSSTGHKIRPTHYLDGPALKDWLLEEKITDTLFGDGAHPEILKRAAPVIRFLSKEGALTLDSVDAVWKSQQGKHEATVRIVFGLINEVVEDLAPELVEALFEKIAAVPSTEHSEMYLSFLKEFTVRAFQAAERAQLETEKPDNEEEPGDNPAVREQSVFADLKAALASPETTCLAPGQKLYGLPVYWKVMQDDY